MSQPNVLVFMTDQQNGAVTLGARHPNAQTPNLDRLRARGVTFTNAYSPAPHCCPSRTSFFTGVYPSEHGVWNNVNVANALSRGPRSDVQFWSADFLEAGYRLAFAGKWHVSNEFDPAELGWTELVLTSRAMGIGQTLEQQRIGAREREVSRLSAADDGGGPGTIRRVGWPNYVHYGVNEDPVEDSAVVRSAIGFIADAGPSATPWFLYVGTLGPHDPYFVPQRFLDLYDPDSIELPANFDDLMEDKPALYRRTRRRFAQLSREEHRQALHHYLALCSYQDYLFGQLVESVEAVGQLENTVIVYLSDHGDYAGEHGLWGKGLPAFRAAYHVPAVFGGPAIRIGSGGTDLAAPFNLVDFGPTILDICGLNGHDMSGTSFATAIRTGRETAEMSETVFLQSNGNELYGIQRTVLTEEWKLVVNLFDEDELYDRRADPDELRNLLYPPSSTPGQDGLSVVPEAYRGIVADLYERLWIHSLAHDDDILHDYILIALATYGPGVASSARESRPAERPVEVPPQRLRP